MKVDVETVYGEEKNESVIESDVPDVLIPEGQDDEVNAVLVTFLEALCDVADARVKRVVAVAGVKRACSIFVRARVAQGDDRVPAVAEGKLVLESFNDFSKQC